MPIVMPSADNGLGLDDTHRQFRVHTNYLEFLNRAEGPSFLSPRSRSKAASEARKGVVSESRADSKVDAAPPQEEVEPLLERTPDEEEEPREEDVPEEVAFPDVTSDGAPEDEEDPPEPEEEDEEEEPEGGDGEDEEAEEEEEENEDMELKEWNSEGNPIASSGEGKGVLNMWQAAWDGEIEIMERFVSQGADLNAFGYDGYGLGLSWNDLEKAYQATKRSSAGVCDATPLHFAACAGQQEMVQWLLGQTKQPLELHLRLRTTGATAKDVARANGLRELVDIMDDFTCTFDLQSPKYRELQRRTEASASASTSVVEGRWEQSALERVNDRAVRKEWALWDQDGQGTITREQLRDAYLSWENYGVEESEQVVDATVDKFVGLLDNGLVCYEEFAAMYCYVQTR